MQPVVTNKPVPTAPATPRQYSDAPYSLARQMPRATSNTVPGETDLSGAIERPAAEGKDFLIGGKYGSNANGR